MKVSDEILEGYATPLCHESEYEGVGLNMEGWRIVESISAELKAARKVIQYMRPFKRRQGGSAKWMYEFHELRDALAEYDKVTGGNPPATP